MRTVRSRSLLGAVAAGSLMATMIFGAGTASASDADTCTNVGTTSTLECTQVPVQPALGATAPPSAAAVTPSTRPVVPQAPAVQQPLVAPAINSAAASDGTYTNSSGQQVPDPVYASTPPPGATALCNDGKYSSSKTRSGTCSSNGGVAQFLADSSTTTMRQATPTSDQFNGQYWDDGQGHHRYGWGWNNARHCWQYAAPAQNDTPVKVSQVSSEPTGGVDTGDGSFRP